MKLSHLLPALAIAIALPTSASAMTKGMNIAWITQGNSNYSHDINSDFSAANWSTWISRAKAGNVSVVRIWLHEGGEGIVFSGTNPTGVSGSWKANLQSVATQAKNNGVSVEWVLLNGAADSSTVNNCFNNRGNFNNNVYSADKSAVSAAGSSTKRWDLCNEVNYALSSANANTFKSAVPGTVYSTDNTGYTGATEFHRYSDSAGQLSTSFKVCGEFGPSTKDTTHFNNAINNFWSDATSKGYTEISPWKIQNTDGYYYYQAAWASTWNNK